MKNNIMKYKLTFTFYNHLIVNQLTLLTIFKINSYISDIWKRVLVIILSFLSKVFVNRFVTL